MLKHITYADNITCNETKKKSNNKMSNGRIFPCVLRLLNRTVH